MIIIVIDKFKNIATRRKILYAIKGAAPRFPSEDKKKDYSQKY
jgi:hypothetical protein